jgi:WD40 repeat protein
VVGYDAFISYSHAADGNLAPSLQEGLQRLAKPWSKRRSLEVFRDRTGLAVTPHLWPEISAALGQARWLVLLASPDSAASKWVNEEIEFFLAKDPTAKERILPVVTGGEWQWAGDGVFTADSSAVPAALHGVFVDEPLYLDLRWAKGRTDLSLHDAVFRAAVADVAAPIHGVSKDELIGEDVRQFRKARIARRAAVFSLVVLTLGALASSAVAVLSSREAVRQRNVAEVETLHAKEQKAIADVKTVEAEEQTAIAVGKAAEARSSELAGSAVSLRADDPAVAALLAVESLYPNEVTDPIETAGSVNAVAATARALLPRLFVPEGGLPEATGQAIVATSGPYVATIGPEEEFACWPVFHDGQPVATPITWWNRATGKRLSAAPPDVELPLDPFINTDWGVMRIDDALTATPLIGRATCDTVAPVYTDPVVYDDSAHLIVALEPVGNQFVTLDPTTMAVHSRMTPLDPAKGRWVDVTAAAGAVIASKQDGSLRVWPIGLGGLGQDFDLTRPASTLAKMGTTVYGADGVLDLSVDPPLATGLPGVFNDVSFALFSADASFLALIDGSCGCRAGIWDVSRPATPILVSTIVSTTVSSLRWLDHVLGLTSARGVEFYAFHEPSVTPRAEAVSADGSTVVTRSSDWVTYEVHDVADPGGAPSHVLDASAGASMQVEISADGRLVSQTSPGAFLVTDNGESYVDGPLTVTDLGLDAEVFRQQQAGQRSQFDPTGRFLMYSYPMDPSTAIVGLRAAAPEAVVEIYDTNSWQQVATVRVPVDVIWSLRWASATELIGRSSTGQLQVLTLASGELTLRQPATDITGSGWWSSPDRQLLVATDNTGRLRLFTGLGSPRPLTLLTTLDAGISEVFDVAFSADSKRMSTAGVSYASVWDVSVPSAARRVDRLEQLPIVTYGAGSTVFSASVRFRPDGRSLVVMVNHTVIELPDFDPTGICAVVSETELRRAETMMGNPSACRDRVQAA